MLSVFLVMHLIVVKAKVKPDKDKRKERHLRFLHFRREIELNSTKANGQRVNMGELSASVFVILALSEGEEGTTSYSSTKGATFISLKSTLRHHHRDSETLSFLMIMF